MNVFKSCLIIFFYTLTLSTCSETPYQYRQVLTVATNTPAPLIDVDSHLRFSKRPSDPYSYPIKVGEIGPTLPLFSGDLTYPFACSTWESGLGQPEVDNHELLGTPVFMEQNGQLTNKVIGFSKDCIIKTQIRFFIASSPEHSTEVFNLETLTLKADEILLRVEQGTINRYIYTLMMPIEQSEWTNRTAQSLWNKRLIYQFAGGVGIGFRQGKFAPQKLIERRFGQLKKGYAVISSSGNKTSHTYNMLQAEDTALRVKKQFISLYGDPLYTVGIGGSGGGLAQYLLAQNAPGLIDGALPLYSYPDMVSQTLYALDCDLFNNYYTFRSDLAYWDNQNKKRALEGLNSEQLEHKSWFFYPINQLLNAKPIYLPKIYSECVNGYFGLSALVNNPDQGFLRKTYSPHVKEITHWSYWQDLANVFGKDQHGYAHSIWDNQGVQYGLKALQEDVITAEEFIDLNFHIGGWKGANEMTKEQLLFIPFTKIGIWLTQWSNHNITQSLHTPAPRSSASLKAVENAYRYGQVFLGYNDIPTIDIHHYLEEQLDMHHVSTVFATRLRILEQTGTAKNHKIWIADAEFTPMDEAFQAMDDWLLKGKPNDTLVSDRCFNKEGEIIAQGDTVWNDSWNNQIQGPCAKHFKIYTNSRIQAGGPWQGSIFKCHTIPVQQAINKGHYGNHNMQDYLPQLTEIFPEGVCDYTQGDSAKPNSLTPSLAP